MVSRQEIKPRIFKNNKCIFLTYNNKYITYSKIKYIIIIYLKSLMSSNKAISGVFSVWANTSEFTQK